MKQRGWFTILIIAAIALMMLQSRSVATLNSNTVDLRKTVLINETAYIPPQCYTRTEDKQKRVYNSCYVCHLKSVEPNYINDWDLQQNYTFPEAGLRNPWTNLFEDRTGRIQAISDREILGYVRMGNYLDEKGDIILGKRLSQLPSQWDHNGNGKWEAYTPDCYFNFDGQGFDRDPNSDFTGWRAFAYYPFPGTYWPTNGSADDVIIRLAPNFQVNEKGEFDLTVYQINLAIVEALINKRSVAIEKVDENRLGVDLDKDGTLGMAAQVVFEWAPLENRYMSYVGQARLDQQQGKVHLAAGLFPEGTEFLQSVRYLDVTPDGHIAPATRTKELRYMKKRTWRTYANIEESAINEIKEKDDFPDRTRQFIGNPEQGVNNDEGWLLQGFIEDKSGNLRPQSFEETVACIGCHGGTGATTDSVYAFSRKLDAEHYRRGWYHWGQKGLSGLNEPKVQIRGAGVYYEYSYYLMYTKSGSEFRDNPDVETTFYNPDGTIRQDMLDQLHEDVTVLLHPSKDRALLLDKAYRTIVEDQDFVKGRDANITAMANVHKDIEQDLPTGVKQASSIDSFRGRFGLAAACESGTKTTAVDAAHQKIVAGRGMSGPSGVRYEADWRGVIRKSRYSLDIEGVHFTFPPRMTLPTPVVVPLGNISSCYACHRLDYPTVPGSKRIFIPVQLAGNPSIPAARDLKQLTADTGRNLGGKWSPDGKKIAYTAETIRDASGEDRVTYAAMVSNIAFKGNRAIAENNTIISRNCTLGDRGPVFSPDGKKIAFWAWDVSYRARLWAYDLDTGQTTQLTSGQTEMYPQWSPDGARLLFESDRSGERDLMLINIR